MTDAEEKTKRRPEKREASQRDQSWLCKGRRHGRPRARGMERGGGRGDRGRDAASGPLEMGGSEARAKGVPAGQVICVQGSDFLGRHTRPSPLQPQTPHTARPPGHRPCVLLSVASVICDIPGKPGDAISVAGMKGIRPHVTAAQGRSRDLNSGFLALSPERFSR